MNRMRCSMQSPSPSSSGTLVSAQNAMCAPNAVYSSGINGMTSSYPQPVPPMNTTPSTATFPQNNIFQTAPTTIPVAGSTPNVQQSQSQGQRVNAQYLQQSQPAVARQQHRTNASPIIPND